MRFPIFLYSATEDRDVFSTALKPPPVFPVSPCLILRMNVLRSVTYEVYIYNIYLDHGAILGCRLSFSSQKIERNLRNYKPILTLWHFSTVATINVIYEQPYIQRSCINIVTCQSPVWAVSEPPVYAVVLRLRDAVHP